MATTLCFVGIYFIGASASSLTYQSSTNVGFTFNPTISISLSSDLLISNLSPGSTSDSNIITVSTSTNNPTGYVLTASVGSSTNATTNLTNGSYNFSSIATDASLASLNTDNTWGYSISSDNGSTWANYSGLPLYTAANWKQIADTNASGTNDFKFKIAAKASTSQASGDYTNVINFTAVANHVPMDIAYLHYMQDFASLDAAGKADVLNSMTLNTQYTLKDSRDQQDYTIAKLSDGNVWMTKNLNLAGGTTLTSEDSNVNSDYTLPASSMTGFGHGGGVYVYNSNSTSCSNSSPCYSYYSASAASRICPKGWKLPTSNDFSSLTSIYSTGPTLTAAPFNGVYSGMFSGSGYGPAVATAGFLWSSSVSNPVGVRRYLDFRNDSVTQSAYDDSFGYGVRCIADS